MVPYWNKAYLLNSPIPNCNIYIELLNSTGEIIDKNTVDNWGYVFDAYYSVWLVDKKEEYREAVLNGFKKLNENYRSFVRTRQAATQSYIGYDDQIRQLKNRIRFADEKIKILLARQGHMLELMSIEELAATVKEAFYLARFMPSTDEETS